MILVHVAQEKNIKNVMVHKYYNWIPSLMEEGGPLAVGDFIWDIFYAL